MGCACSSSLGGVWDDLKAQGSALIAQGTAKATQAAQPYVNKVNEGLDKLDMALKIIMALSAIGAITGVINLRKRH